MWGRSKTKPETISVTGDGLAKLVLDLWSECGGFIALEYGFTLNVRPSMSSDRTVVMLTSYQTEVLLRRLPGRTLTTEYGEV